MASAVLLLCSGAARFQLFPHSPFTTRRSFVCLLAFVCLSFCLSVCRLVCSLAFFIPQCQPVCPSASKSVYICRHRLTQLPFIYRLHPLKSRTGDSSSYLVGWSVSRSVGLSVRWSVHLFVFKSVIFLNCEQFLHYCRDWRAVYPALFYKRLSLKRS